MINNKSFPAIVLAAARITGISSSLKLTLLDLCWESYKKSAAIDIKIFQWKIKTRSGSKDSVPKTLTKIFAEVYTTTK